MQREACKRTEVHYYSEHLSKKLEGLRHARATIIEAPPGYGKTTAVRDRLCNVLPPGTPVYWLTATDEATSACFQRFARIVDAIDPVSGRRLLAADPLNAVTIGDACEAVRSICCAHETYLIIDNFHLLHAATPDPFVSALVEHGGDALRVVLLTHPLNRKTLPERFSHGLLQFTTEDFTLNAADIRSYYALADVHITQKAAMRLADATGGWIAAVCLQLRALRERGALFDGRDILTLMERIVWDTLTERQRIFLMRLSPFETLTLTQICALLRVDALHQEDMDALSCPFIQLEPVEQRYEIHTILSKLLTQKRLAKGDAFNNECMWQAGRACRDMGLTREALGFFWQVKDYAQILSLDLSEVLFSCIGDVPFAQIAWDVAQHCPAEVKQAHLLSMLRMGLALLAGGMRAPFRMLMDEHRDMLAALDDPPELVAEWLLLTSLGEYPCAERMMRSLQQASALFGGRQSKVIQPSAPFGIANCVPIAVYHTSPGAADREAEWLDDYLALYTAITGGHGYGAGALYRAQCAYQRGDLENAEILAYQASYQAENKQQSIVQLWAAHQLAQVALHRADTAGWWTAVSGMELAASQPMRNSRIFQSALDIARGVLLAELQQFSGIADWLKAGDFSEQRLLPDMIPMALFIHMSCLLEQGDSARLVGIAQARYAEGLGNTPMHAALSALTVAAAYMQMKDTARAIEYVHQAALAALPDGMFFLFASFSWLLHGLSDEIFRKEFPAFWNDFLAAKRRFGLGWRKLYQDMTQSELPEKLTAREMEVAKLAASGLRNAEIAERLSLSNATVRAHLRAIFQKLDVDRRAKLADVLK